MGFAGAGPRGREGTVAGGRWRISGGVRYGSAPGFGGRVQGGRAVSGQQAALGVGLGTGSRTVSGVRCPGTAPDKDRWCPPTWVLPPGERKGSLDTRQVQPTRLGASEQPGHRDKYEWVR